MAKSKPESEELSDLNVVIHGLGNLGVSHFTKKD